MDEWKTFFINKYGVEPPVSKRKVPRRKRSRPPPKHHYYDPREEEDQWEGTGYANFEDWFKNQGAGAKGSGAGYKPYYNASPQNFINIKTPNHSKYGLPNNYNGVKRSCSMMKHELEQLGIIKDNKIVKRAYLDFARKFHPDKLSQDLPKEDIVSLTLYFTYITSYYNKFIANECRA
jgi:hypothetical protein